MIGSIVSGIFNTVGGLLGSVVGQPPPLPPPLPLPPPPPPPQPVPAPNEPGKVIYITQAPLPPPTRAPETLTTYGIIGIVFCLVILMCCVAAGIGFYCWQTQKAEMEKRANDAAGRDRDMEMGGGGRRGRRGGGYTSGTTGTTGRTKTKRHKRR